MADSAFETNKSLQDDEILAVSAIYENDWVTEDADRKIYSIKISNMGSNQVHFQVSLPETYPLDSPPIYEISAPWMSRIMKQNLRSRLEDIYFQNIGTNIIFLWIEVIRTFINNSVPEEKSSLSEDLKQSLIFEAISIDKKNEVMVDEVPPIEHGDPIVDRKSVFQAHIANVVSVEQVNQVLQKLKETRKIATATHNIFAYRISRGDGKTFIQDFDDDGETKAASGLLHLLQIVDVRDIVVVVSRWYGGVHLGPDRFKHINNAARSLLSKLGYIPKSRSSTR